MGQKDAQIESTKPALEKKADELHP
jgi:hypothetical protein